MAKKKGPYVENRAELQRIKDSREVIPDPMRSEESMKLIEEIFKKCNGNLL